MKLIYKTFFTIAIVGASITAQAETTKDCMLKGTVQRSGEGTEERVGVKFHSMERYDTEANCRQRRGEKMQFKLPSDPRLQDAPAGTDVEFRYREDDKGNAETQLLSVGA
ncbi:MAG: hypothetical protein AAGI11_12215 [Pseudomonadota bacterium]